MVFLFSAHFMLAENVFGIVSGGETMGDDVRGGTEVVEIDRSIILLRDWFP